MTYTGQLSKWWRTKSARAAMRRHRKAQQEKFRRLRKIKKITIYDRNRETARR